MRTYDRESGIRGIEYVVIDVITGARIWNGTLKGQKETTVINTHYSSYCVGCDM